MIDECQRQRNLDLTRIRDGNDPLHPHMGICPPPSSSRPSTAAWPTTPSAASSRTCSCSTPRPARRSATWDAVQASLQHRSQLATLNPHVIVTNATRTGNAPADGSYLIRRLDPVGTRPSACRQTRIAQLVNDLDPKLTAAALGMRDSVRYLADNVDRDRLQRTPSG
jgi:hypothetical protein